jgi:hypothetical protein
MVGERPELSVVDGGISEGRQRLFGLWSDLGQPPGLPFDFRAHNLQPGGLPPERGGASFEHRVVASAGAGSTPIKGLTVNGNYATTRSNTSGDASSSNNRMSQGNVFLQYMFRKLYFAAGYSRLLQGFSSTGNPPNVVSSYYVGVSRWFNFF